VSALDLLGIGFPLSGTLVVGLLWWLFRGALPVSPEDGIDGAGGNDGGSDRVPPRPPRPWLRTDGRRPSRPHRDRPSAPRAPWRGPASRPGAGRRG
jgi:hypothetical protein